MAWGSVSVFAGFLEKENSLETLIVIFENVSPKAFFWLNMKNFEISVLTANSRYLQTAALKQWVDKNKDSVVVIVAVIRDTKITHSLPYAILR